MKVEGICIFPESVHFLVLSWSLSVRFVEYIDCILSFLY